MITSYDVVIMSSLSNCDHIRSAILNFPKLQESAVIQLNVSNKVTLIWVKNIKVTVRKVIFLHFRKGFSTEKLPVKNYKKGQGSFHLALFYNICCTICCWLDPLLQDPVLLFFRDTVTGFYCQKSVAVVTSKSMNTNRRHQIFSR